MYRHRKSTVWNNFVNYRIESLYLDVCIYTHVRSTFDSNTLRIIKL